jgi:hypothetical protein
MTVRRLLMIAGCVIAAGFFAACGDDLTSPPRPEPIVFKDLTSRDDVLFNLELAYNERNIAEYAKLLDEHFVFYFGEWDYRNGTVPFEQWERAAEVESNTKILSQSNPDPNRIISIHLELDYSSGGWIEEPPGGRHLDETWYVKTAVYRLVIKTADQWEYQALGLMAQFKVRWAETDNGDFWRIVEWRDDVRSTAVSRVAGDLDPRPTWGAAKSGFHGGI